MYVWHQDIKKQNKDLDDKGHGTLQDRKHLGIKSSFRLHVVNFKQFKFIHYTSKAVATTYLLLCILEHILDCQYSIYYTFANISSGAS